MKVLILDPADFLGGAELFTVDTVSTLQKEIEFLIISSGQCTDYVAKLPKRAERIQIPIPRLRPFHPIKLYQGVRGINKYIQQSTPDIIHSNSVRAGIILSFLKKPWTHFVHDFTTPRILIPLFKKANHIFTCSQSVKKDLIQKGLSQEKITVIPNGINIKDFQKISKEKRGGNTPIIGIVGRIDWWKGQNVFLKAASLLQKKLPNAEFHIYGTSSEHDQGTQLFEKELKEYVQKEKLKNVHFCGHKKREEILSKIDLLVHASTQPEPFGRVIIEALGAGVPCIASNIGGPQEIYTKDLKEFLIEPNKPEILAKKIEWFLENPEIQKKFQRAAKIRAKDFDLQKTSHKLLEKWQLLTKTNL